MHKSIVIVSAVLLTLLISGCGDSGSSSARTITVDITVDSLPATIDVEKATSPDNVIEYSWAVTFDANGDHVISAGDIMLRLYYDRDIANPPATVPVDSLKAKVMSYLTAVQVVGVGNADVSVAGNTITLSAKDNVHSALKLVTDSTDLYFETSFYDTPLVQYDYNPSAQTLMSASGNGQYTDPQADATPQLIDMVSMQVTIEE